MFSFSGTQLACEHAKALVVLFHGYGADGANLLPVAQALSLPNVFFWLPDGPTLCEGYGQGYQWFSLRTIQFGPNAAPPETFNTILQEAAEPAVQEIKRGIGSFKGPIIVGGFSQGAALAYHIGLQVMPVQGILGFSGFYDLTSPPRFSPPLFWAHGSNDDVVPVSWMTHAVKQIEKFHLNVETHICSSGRHEISLEAGAKGKKFLQRVLEPFL